MLRCTAETEARQDLHKLLGEALLASRSLTAELSPPVLHADGFLAALRWLAEWMATTHQFTVHLTTDPSAEPTDEATKVFLFRCVRELLLNAVKHAGVSDATVAVTRREAHVEVVVADQGKGFAVAPRLSRTGTGLGLASIRQRLEYLGGRMDITSAPGQGSRFTLTVPLERDARIESPPTSSRPHLG